MKKNTQSALSSLSFLFPALSRPETSKELVRPYSILARLRQWLGYCFPPRGNGRRIQVSATAPLGDKRFVAVVKVDEQEFLVGGGAGNVTLLAQLAPQGANFSDLLEASGQAAKVKVDSANAPKIRKRRTAVEPPAKIAQRRKAAVEVVAEKPVVKSRKVSMPRLTAQVNIAPVLGRFRAPESKSARPKAEKTTTAAKRTRTSKSA